MDDEDRRGERKRGGGREVEGETFKVVVEGGKRGKGEAQESYVVEREREGMEEE